MGIKRIPNATQRKIDKTVQALETAHGAKIAHQGIRSYMRRAKEIAKNQGRIEELEKELKRLRRED